MKFLVFIVALFVIWGCKKDDTNPDSKARLIYDLQLIHGNDQAGEYNAMLTDSLVVKVIDQRNRPAAGRAVQFILKKGTGDISPDWVVTDSAGMAFSKLKVGCNDDAYEVNACLVDSLGSRMDSVTFYGKVALPSGWGKACGIDYTGPFETVFREQGDIIYLANYDKIYTSDDGGISWQVLENMPPTSSFSYIFDIQFNSRGWMYVATRNDGIFYTRDQKIWHQINNGIYDYRDPVGFLVEDDCLFASFYFGGLYRSVNNGASWEKIMVGNGYSDRYSHIKRHPNGDVYLFDDWDTFWHSDNNGSSWNSINLNYKYRNYEIEDFVISEDGDLYIGSHDATIAILSADTYEGELHSYYKWNASTQSVDDIQIKDGIVYFSVNYNPMPGIYSSQNWSRIELGFEKTIYTYLLKQDCTFLIAADDGVYYHNAK